MTSARRAANLQSPGSKLRCQFTFIPSQPQVFQAIILIRIMRVCGGNCQGNIDVFCWPRQHSNESFGFFDRGWQPTPQQYATLSCIEFYYCFAGNIPAERLICGQRGNYYESFLSIHEARRVFGIHITRVACFGFRGWCSNSISVRSRNNQCQHYSGRK
jgi:hypothetical protein